MSRYFAILLALAAAVAHVEGGHAQALPAPEASETGESPSDYHQRSRAAVREVLGRREFADINADPYATLRTTLTWLEAFLQGIHDFFKALPEWLVWTVLVCLVLALVAILAYLIYTLVMLLRGTSSSQGKNPKAGGVAGELLGIKDLEFDAVLAEARRLLAAGDWPAATSYFYVAAILWLDGQGWIVFKRSKTNRDYIDELVARAGTQGSFQHLTAQFEPIVYGGNTPTSSTIHDIATTVEGLLHEHAGASAS